MTPEPNELFVKYLTMAETAQGNESRWGICRVDGDDHRHPALFKRVIPEEIQFQIASEHPIHLSLGSQASLQLTWLTMKVSVTVQGFLFENGSRNEFILTPIYYEFQDRSRTVWEWDTQKREWVHREESPK